jgi:hypothetical protein
LPEWQSLVAEADPCPILYSRQLSDRIFRMQPAYYAASISTFLFDDPDAILGQLTQHAQDVTALQRYAWVQQIAILQRELAPFKEGAVAFEFSIPRMGKRVDAVVILAGIVFLLEFKVGENEFTAATRDQVMDYALDLKNFHAGSHTRRIVPIMVATKAPTLANSLLWSLDGVANTLMCNSDNLGATLTAVIQQSPKQDLLDYQAWATSGYRPTPTIIEAAQALYSGHHVEEITRSDAGAKNLSETTACLAHIIETAKAKQHKAICFVTGVPGAGKTLAGLNLVTHRTQAHGDEHAVFLSGNGPLVEVIREALARDEILRLKEKGQVSSKADATRKVKTFIQNIHHFLIKHARALIYVLSWIPDTKEAVDAAERGRMTDVLFEAAFDAYKRDCQEVYEAARDTLLSWSFNAARHQLSWAILERSMCGLATLALWKLDPAELATIMQAIGTALTKDGAPSQEMRNRTARELRREAATLRRREFELSPIKNPMNQIDAAKMRPVLQDIANLLSPNTAGEPVRIGFI